MKGQVRIKLEFEDATTRRTLFSASDVDGGADDDVELRFALNLICARAVDSMMKQAPMPIKREASPV